MSNLTSPPIRYVVFHRPGLKWRIGIDFREQDAGGMMVTTKDVTQQELESFAAADPAVESRLLIYGFGPG